MRTSHQAPPLKTSLTSQYQWFLGDSFLTWTSERYPAFHYRNDNVGLHCCPLSSRLTWVLSCVACIANCLPGISVSLGLFSLSPSSVHNFENITYWETDKDEEYRLALSCFQCLQFFFFFLQKVVECQELSYWGSGVKTHQSILLISVAPCTVSYSGFGNKI